MKRPLILVTNDDGIDSPGLAAAVAALDPLGELLIVAPLEQQTSMGRSRSQHGGADGHLVRKRVRYGDRTWDGVGACASPALSLEHGLQELASRPVDLVVSGINYGENVGTSITASGTIGAAMEAAEHGIPALAVSLELDDTGYYTYNPAVDFSTAMHFTRFFAGQVLSCPLPEDVGVLKVDVPSGATPETRWIVTRQDRLVYYTLSIAPRDDPFGGPCRMLHAPAKGKYTQPGTDAFALAEGLVSVTPLSLDLTSRVPLDDLQRLLKRKRPDR